MRLMSEVITEHVQNCEQCRTVARSTVPRGLGQLTYMCPLYLQIIKSYADYEGAILNGKDPDEISIVPVTDTRHVGG